MHRLFFTVTIMLACALSSGASPGRVSQRDEVPVLRLAAEEADPIIGKWRWHTGNTIELNDEHKLLFGEKEVGSWALVKSSPARLYRLDWNLSDGHYIDNLTLTEEDRLEGTNNLGISISADKLPSNVWRNP